MWSKFAVLFCLLICKVSADEILGCGGFIKTDVEINFSLIEVKLYTKQGSLKYQTDCAPNNGYYMLPVYNKGEYIIKVEAPSGWTFEPQSYSIAIDGMTDKCTLSEDINFIFTGFGIIGKVLSKDHETGPAGVLLTLKSPQGKVFGETKSVQGGSYTFEKILPGNYVVEASHDVWKIESSKGTVSLSKETGRVTNTIIVSGFDVKGKILSEGEAVSGVTFFLLGPENQNFEFCPTREIDQQAPTLDGHKVACSSVSDLNGIFEFPSVRPGNYVLMPFYKSEMIKYDVTPSRMDIRVDHDSFVVKEPFQVAGFVVTGRVRRSANGIGVVGAQVLVNGSPSATTGDEGHFHLEAMKTGSYRLEAGAPRMKFDALEVKVTPNTPRLPDLIASKFEVCGKIIVSDTNGAFSASSRNVVFRDEKGAKYAEVKSLEDGSFCLYTAPGSYKCSVMISEKEKDAGFRLLPHENEVRVVASPVDGVTFSQFRARVSGTIVCLQSCGTIRLVLQSSSKTEDSKSLEVSSDTNSVDFHFENIVAGNYELAIQNDKWCWTEKVLRVNVMERDVMDLSFSQSGYSVISSLSHDAQLTFDPLSKEPGKDDSVLKFDVTRGLNNFCLKKTGVYLVSVESCHKFESDSYKYDTSLGGVLSLNANLHKVEISVASAPHRDHIMAFVRNQYGETITVGPLVLDELSAEKGINKYSTQYWARSDEILSVTVDSGMLLFDPESVQVKVKPEACPSGEALFTGRQGAFIEGEVVPPLPGFLVTILLGDGKTIYTATNMEGKYKTGPVDANLSYEVSLSKSGYAFKASDERPGLFRASKLAEIVVTVADEGTGSYLPGVLLSLSGEESFRRNNVTQEGESLAFTNLGPGKYFLKPMMKEYEFEPSSLFLEVEEGATVEVTLLAMRVAFSCYGHVTSLNGEPEVGVHLEAVAMDDGKDECQGHQEESKTESDGSIRIRGLKPGCSYVLRLKEDRELNAIIERTSPSRIKIEVGQEDVQDVNFVAFRRINNMDISGRVVAQQEHLSSLKVHLLQEANVDAPQHTANLGPSPFFYFSSIPIDNKSYVLRLASSLSRTGFNFSLPELQFRADAPFKHFTFHFNPQPKLGDQELAHSSLLVLPLTIFILYFCYHRKQAWPFISRCVLVIFSTLAARAASSSSSSSSSSSRSSPPPPPVASSSSSSSVDQFASEFTSDSSFKKRPKAKKI